MNTLKYFELSRLSYDDVTTGRAGPLSQVPSRFQVSGRPRRAAHALPLPRRVRVAPAQFAHPASRLVRLLVCTQSRFSASDSLSSLEFYSFFPATALPAPPRHPTPILSMKPHKSSTLSHPFRKSSSRVTAGHAPCVSRSRRFLRPIFSDVTLRFPDETYAYFSVIVPYEA